jgi:hypothetical protein
MFNHMRLFRADSPEYVKALQTVLRCTNERVFIKQVLRELISTFWCNAVAVDWGAENGALTHDLLMQFKTVYAVEPHPQLRSSLARNCPGAVVIPGTAADVKLPQPVDLGIMSHMLYYLPEHEWGGLCLKAASQLNENGMLVVILKHPTSGCSKMHEAFGASRCNLYQLVETFRHFTGYDVTFRVTPGRFQTTSFEETLDIARFMMSDRPLDLYKKLPTEAEFQSYVRTHFWNEARQQGGWDCPQLFAVVTRNPFYTSREVEDSRVDDWVGMLSLV